MSDETLNDSTPSTAAELLDTIRNRTEFRLANATEEHQFRIRFQLSNDEWAWIEAYRQRRSRKDAKKERDKWIDNLQERCGAEVVENFLAERFPGAKEREKRFIREQISKAVKVRDDSLLTDITNNGLPGLRKQIRKRRARFLRHTWAALKALLSIGIVFALYGKLQTDFEIIVCSILIRLYTQVMRTSWGLSLQGASFNHAGFIRYLSLKQFLGFDTEADEQKGHLDLEDGLKNSAVRYHVVDAGNSIVNVIVYWQIIKLFL